MTTTNPLTTSSSSATSFSPLPAGLTPDSIDILPTLSLLLADLRERPLHNPHQLTPAPTASAAGAPLIASKDLPAATDELKRKLQKARVQVRELPDMERGVEEQEEQMRELESRIREQREVLRGLREVGEGCRKEREERLGKGQGIEG